MNEYGVPSAGVWNPAGSTVAGRKSLLIPYPFPAVIPCMTTVAFNTTLVVSFSTLLTVKRTLRGLSSVCVMVCSTVFEGIVENYSDTLVNIGVKFSTKIVRSLALANKV